MARRLNKVSWGTAYKQQKIRPEFRLTELAAITLGIATQLTFSESRDVWQIEKSLQELYERKLMIVEDLQARFTGIVRRRLLSVQSFCCSLSGFFYYFSILLSLKCEVI